jgi:hydrogenase expression/formation protein HypD
MSEAARWLDRIHALALPRPVRILNVCGGHERSIAQAGLRGVLPPAITLIPGPGCPVCVCPEADILAAIRLSQDEQNILPM